MACPIVALARRLASTCFCWCLPCACRAAEASSKAWRRASSWASSFARWALARASVTCFGVFFGCLDTIEHCLLLVIQETTRQRERMRKDVACIFLRLRQKMSRKNEGRISPPRSALEQVYQAFCAKTREAGGLPLITTSFFSPKLLLFLPNVCHHVDHFQRKQDRQGRLLVKRCGVGYSPLMQVGGRSPCRKQVML